MPPLWPPTPKLSPYADLEAQSNALARHLKSLGALPETLIALVLDRSPEFAIAALATWKTGAAYLPIDPACPAERIRLILDDARAPILIRSGLASPNRTVPGIRKTGGHLGPPFLAGAPIPRPRFLLQINRPALPM